MVGCEFGTGTFRSHALSFPGTKVDVSFQGTKSCLVTFVLMNWGVGLLGSRYSMHHYELYPPTS